MARHRDDAYEEDDWDSGWPCRTTRRSRRYWSWRSVSSWPAGVAHHAAAEQEPVVRVLDGQRVHQVQGQNKTEEKKTEQANAAGLERRVAGLEAEIAKLVKEVQSLRTELKAAGAEPEVNGELVVFKLKNSVKAAEIQTTLRELFGSSPRIAIHAPSNTILVRGSAEQVETVGAVIRKLEGVD